MSTTVANHRRIIDLPQKYEFNKYDSSNKMIYSANFKTIAVHHRFSFYIAILNATIPIYLYESSRFSQSR